MQDKSDGKVHYLWAVVAGLGAALAVSLCVLAVVLLRGTPGKAAMTAEEDREYLEDFLAKEIIKLTPASPALSFEERYYYLRKSAR